MIQRTWWPRLNPNAQLAKGLVFAGLGGGASTLQYADASGYGNHGTLTNGAGWVFDPNLGRFVLSLTAQGQYVTAPSVGLGAEDFSISAWAYRLSGSADYSTIVAQGTTGIGEWMLRSSVSNDQYNFYGSAGNINAGATSTVANDVWKHVAAVRSGSSCGIWVDGVPYSPDTTANCDLSTTKSMHMGGSESVATRWWVGKLADIMIWRGVAIGTPNASSSLIQQLADPSNTLLSGLILPPRRMVWPVAVAEGAYSLDCDSGSFTLAGQDVTLTTARTLDAASGEFTLTGQDVGLNRGYPLSAESGSFTLAGQDVGLTAARTIGADNGEFTLAGQDATLTADRTLSAENAEFTLAGQDATLTYTPVGEYSLTADSGSFTLAGQDVGLTADRTLSSDNGEFTLTGQDAGLAHGYVLSAESGDYTLTGQDVTLSRTWALVVESAEYVLTGQAVTLTYSGVNQDGVLWTPAARPRVWTPAARLRVWTPSG